MNVENASFSIKALVWAWLIFLPIMQLTGIISISWWIITFPLIFIVFFQTIKESVKLAMIEAIAVIAENLADALEDTNSKNMEEVFKDFMSDKDSNNDKLN